jgi:hypothetical protein
MRLVTRGDLDGLVSAVLITTMEDVDSMELVHPQHITDHLFDVRDTDVLANLPYHPACAMWFDHHELTESNLRPAAGFRGRHAIEPSVARVILDYYASDRLAGYGRLVAETDRFDAARLTREDVDNPRGAIMLGFLIDPRTGIGAYKVFFKSLVERLKTMEVEEVLAQPDVAQRVELYREGAEAFREALRKHSRMVENVVITDFRGLESIPVGNRFVVYSLYPEASVSVRLQWGPRKQFVAATLGHSIFNRTCRTDIGELCSDYGGGGHRGAGACPLEPDTAEEQVEEIVRRLADGEA